MINPKRLDLSLRTNSQFDQIYNLVESGVPVNLTGYTMEMEFKRSPTGTTLATITPSVVSPATGGAWLLSIPAATIASIYTAVVTNANDGEPITIQHDIIFTEGGTGRVWFTGLAVIEKGITNG